MQALPTTRISTGSPVMRSADRSSPHLRENATCRAASQPVQSRPIRINTIVRTMSLFSFSEAIANYILKRIFVNVAYCIKNSRTKAVFIMSWLVYDVRARIINMRVNRLTGLLY